MIKGVQESKALINNAVGGTNCVLLAQKKTMKFSFEYSLTHCQTIALTHLCIIQLKLRLTGRWSSIQMSRHKPINKTEKIKKQI